MRTVPAGAVAMLLVVGACSDPGGSRAQFCEQVEVGVAENITVFSPDDPTDADEVVRELDALAEVAPGEIDADIDVLRDAVARIAEIFAAGTDSDAVARLQREQTDAEPDITAAQDAVVTYVAGECDIDLTGG